MRARDALICVFVAVILLLLIEGASIRNSGKKMDSGIQRSVVLAVGHPAGWLADQLPLAAAADKLTASLSPDDDLSGGPGGFNSAPVGGGPVQAAGEGAARPAPITADAFDPAELGVKPEQLPTLKNLLVTGDSLAQPLDVQLARAPRRRRRRDDPRRAPRHRHLEDRPRRLGPALDASRSRTASPTR